MKMFKNFLLELLVGFALVAAVPVVLAQPDQSGFISIDCGLAENAKYNDSDTGIFYVSDTGFTDSGVNVAISPTHYRQQPFLSARSFPEGDRNCYTLRPEKGKNNKYLIRARFMYGNYDGKNQLPEFDLYIGEDFWRSVSLANADDAFKWEIIHTPSTDYIHVCLHKTGETIPFISALELRPLNNTLYTTESGSLELYGRWDLGSVSGDSVRYPDDVYDRMWLPMTDVDASNDLLPNTSSLSTNFAVNTNAFQVPSAVMSTAATPQNPSGSLYISWEPYNSSDQFYLYLHFAEVEKLQSNDTRQSQIYLNGERWYKEFSPSYLKTFTIYSTSPELVQLTKYELTINSTQTSTLPPIINALEIYKVKEFKNSGTDDTDVAAMIAIKSYYGLTRNWQGDPCAPRVFTWEGLSCYYDRNTSNIVSLNLSSSGLNGSITPLIANLTSIQTLDLSNNNLDGNVPDFLAQLTSLTVLNLAGNNFSGPIPAELQKKSKQGLSLSIDGLPENANNGTGKRKNKVVLPIVASILAAVLVLFC